MTDQGSVLISGAGITGPALAYWLHRYGWRSTVLERAAELRASGQNVDVRGAGRQVTRLMGLDDQIAEAGTGEVGTRFLDRRGRTVTEFPAGTGNSDGATAEREILRGELVRLLVDQTTGTTEYVYGDQITAVHEDDTGVTVSFGVAPARRFDLVLIAEGMRSRTRGLIFGDTVRLKDLGQYTGYGTIPRTLDDDQWWRWYVADRGRAVTLRPDNLGTTRATLSQMTPPNGYEDLDTDRQIAALRVAFADAGWQSRRVLDAFAADPSDFYLQRTAQVYADSWSRGRVALVGDAAYCASPISGMGTSLSLAGAYVLAGEIATRRDHRDAFRSYETLLRPYVAKAQKLPPGAPRIVNPKTGLGVRVVQTALRVAGSRPARKLGNTFFTPPADDFTLPQYPAPR